MKVYIVAGEPSGDLLASSLMRALRQLVPDVEFRGVGGETMSVVPAKITDSHNFKSLFNISEIAVMGIFEVLPRLPLIIKRIKQTVNDIEAWRPDVLVTVDSWGFASALLTRLRRKWKPERPENDAKHKDSGSDVGRLTYRLPPVIHYVAPQVWAWKKGRAKNVARLVDRLMTLLPSEGQYFEKYGLQSDFVGHPVMERVNGAAVNPKGFRSAHNIPVDAAVVSVLPGSRRQEIRRLGPIFEKAVKLLREKWADGESAWASESIAVPSRISVSISTHIPANEALAATATDDAVEQKSKWKGKAKRLLVIEPSSIKNLDERFNAFATSTIAIAKSGTVSLELAALGVPHLIAYKFGWLSNFAAWLLVKVRFANLINILADREIIPEFVLWNCRPELIAECAYDLLSVPEKAAWQVAEAQKVLEMLRLPDILPSDRAAQIVVEVATNN